MPGKRLSLFVTVSILAISSYQSAWAGDLKITLPKRSQPTPVQRLNREGVDAIDKGQYEKAEMLFYKAYLFDPADPFTLYNLGYISELKGQLERAQNFYGLASKQSTDAVIDRTSVDGLEGKPMKEAFGSLKNVAMQVNRMNVEAMRLLSQNRAPEAEVLLRHALTLDPRNTFTLNNMGVAEESRGDYDEALKYYKVAADSNSIQPVIVTLDRAWRGKPVSEMAAGNATRLRERMQNSATGHAKAEMLTVRGVSATNHNDWASARQDFIDAYSLDPYSAFSLNNLGYVAEMDGDLETAEFFYERARKADDAKARVGLATQRSAEGMKLFAVAGDSDQKVDSKITEENQARQRQRGLVELKHRDNTPVVEPAPPTAIPFDSPPNTSRPPASQPPQ